MRFEFQRIKRRLGRLVGPCGICGLVIAPDNYSVDHIVPLSLGGSNESSNLQPAHRSCNASKRDGLRRNVNREASEKMKKNDPVLEAIRTAPLDDEPYTIEERALVAKALAETKKGCPKHPGGIRECIDVRCQATWSPEGAPTPEEQLQLWVTGKSVCPNTRHECCPDFSCCKPHLGWPLDKRQKYMAAGRGEQEKMMMGALSTLVRDEFKKAHVTRGEPGDHS